MKAMILAAGLGTRLHPLTSIIPKPLVPVANQPVIERTIRLLKKHGIHEIIVNAYHHHNQITGFLDQGRPFGVDIEVRVEREILGTGGGIKNTEDFWDTEPFVVINSDIVTDIDISEACADHKTQGNLVTMVLHDHPPFNQIKTDKNLDIKDIAQKNLPNRYAFTGIHIIEPVILKHIPEGIFSNIIECYRELIRKKAPIRGRLFQGHYWRDIGTIESYMSANREMIRNESVLIGKNCEIHKTANIHEWAVMGNNVVLEKEVEIRGSVLWENVRVKKGVKIINSVVTHKKEIKKDLINKIF